MRKKGFTLTEILLSMAIIAILSAILIPSLNSNVRNRSYASTLSTTVNAIDTAFALMLTSKSANSLDETSLLGMTPENFAKEFINHIKLNNYSTNFDSVFKDSRVKLLDSTIRAEITENTNFEKSCLAFETSGGALVILSLKSTEPSATAQEKIEYDGGTLTSAFSDVIIDVNGKSQNPNMIGRDIFYYKLGMNGRLYPYGSEDVSLLLNTNRNAIFPCKEGNGYGCAAKLLKDGYKMEY